jgi:hypothetical protein
MEFLKNYSKKKRFLSLAKYFLFDEKNFSPFFLSVTECPSGLFEKPVRVQSRKLQQSNQTSEPSAFAFKPAAECHVR